MLTLTPVMQKFILHWGEMGSRWGINRTVAQVHALLYISPRALHAEEIAKTLSVARSNVSTSLKDLQTWGIIKVVHVLGDRRDHFESLKGVWEMFQLILDERKRREIDPTLEILRHCVAEVEEAQRSGRADPADRQTGRRLSELLDFFSTMNSWYDQIRRLPTASLIKFLKLGGKVRKLLGSNG
jgi:DNA-binding transcriptional regulator GbsR (MarR family)